MTSPGPAGDPNNCGLCGRMCAQTNVSTSACSSGACAPKCTANHVSCSSPTPDDGCECVGAACCTTGCQTAHSNGVGQTFYDCSPLGTYTGAAALEACAAFSGSASSCCGGIAGTNLVNYVSGTTEYQWVFTTNTGISSDYVAGNLLLITGFGGDSCANASRGTVQTIDTWK